MDQKLLLLINRDWTWPLLDRFMAVWSSLDFWLPLLIAGAVTLLVCGGFRARGFLLLALVCLGMADGVVSNSLKHLIHRPRPAEALGGVRQVDLAKAKPRLLALARPLTVRVRPLPQSGVEGRSFPSSHVVNTVAVALIAACFFPRAARGLALVVGLVGYSRIYTGSHWPSDVAASLFLGAGLGLLVIAAGELAWRQGGVRWWPALALRHPSLFSA